MECKICQYQETLKMPCTVGNRSFFSCPHCKLIFVPQSDWLSVEEEKKRYALHTNDINDAGYVNYFQHLIPFVESTIPSNGTVLDFGAGEHAVLTHLLQKRHISTTSYDPLYQSQDALPGLQYDCIILSEVIEHVRELKKDWLLLGSHLKTKGSVIVRTQTYCELTNFQSWWYVQDPTHINFLSIQTLEFLASLLKRSVVKTKCKDIFIVT
jgi:hypothetical protein